MWLSCHAFMIAATITLIGCRLEVISSAKSSSATEAALFVEACQNIICVITTAVTIHDIIIRVGRQLCLASTYLIVVNTALIHVSTRI